MTISPWKRLASGVLILAMLAACILMGRSTTKTVAPAYSTVAIVRSERPSVYEITAEEIRDMVRRAVALAGGLEGIIKPGDTVVLKPNLVEMRDFIGERSLLPELLSGVATDRRVVAAVAELAHEAGAAEILVMEGSAVSTALTFAHYGYTSENLPYVDAIIPIEEDSGGWREYDASQLVEVELPDGRYQKTYYLNRRYYEADVVISLPTLKNHWDAAVTGAVKNVAIGATPANIYRNEPGDIWRSRIPHDGDRYHSFMRDYYKCKPVGFAVMDGLVGIQHGPTPNSNVGSRGYQDDCMNMRCILASRDPLALDTIEALITGWDPETVKYLQYLGADGLGNTDPARIMVAGQPVAEVRQWFEGRRPPAGGAQYWDTEPPEVEVARAGLSGDTYLITLGSAGDAVKIEAYVDGQLAGLYNRDLTAIKLDVSNMPPGEHQVSLWAFDRFLNCLELPPLTFTKS